MELILEAPRSGIWKLDAAAHGGISFVRQETDWHSVASEDEAFYLRIAEAGGYRRLSTLYTVAYHVNEGRAESAGRG